MSDSIVTPDHTERSLADVQSLLDRVAVVTGGARGIGAAIARRLVEAGATVIIADIDQRGAVTTAAELEHAHGGRVRGVHLDITQPAEVTEVVSRILAEFGRLDIWVNNAGIYPPTGDPLLATDEHLRSVMDVNVLGTFVAAREAAKVMSAGGVIINIASTAGLRASTGTLAYIASKHAVVGLTKSLAVELGRRGIRVLGIAPEVTLTPGVAEASEALKAAGYDSAGQQSLNLFGRRAQPDDMARVVLFLASDMAAWMTGSVIPVDAGRLAVLG